MRSTLNVSGVLALLVLLSTAALVAAHYVNVTNNCVQTLFTGSIRDTRWRGRTKPLVVGRTDTEGDTTVSVSTAMGNVNVNLSFNGSTMDMKLNPALDTDAAFGGTLGYDVSGGGHTEQISCSEGAAVDCWKVLSLDNPMGSPAYANLVFAC